MTVTAQRAFGNSAQASAWVAQASAWVGSFRWRGLKDREKSFECIMMSNRNNDYERSGLPVLWLSAGLSDRTRQNMGTQAKAWAKFPRPFGPTEPNADSASELGTPPTRNP
jgi:hypothetical protein